MERSSVPETAESRYRAFLSYSHKDEAWGARLHRRLEAYKIPARLVGTQTARGEVPARLSPIFRDREELSAGESLSAQVQAALAASECLIVMCSPNAKASPWVGREIDLFRSIHPDRPVFAALIEGEPGEAFPEALLKSSPSLSRGGGPRSGGGGPNPDTAGAASPSAPSVSADALPPPRDKLGEDLLEPIAADFRKTGDGPQMALLKLVAGMTGVPLDGLVQRDHQRQLRRVTAITGGAIAATLIMGLLLVFALQARREADRQRGEAEGLVEYMLTDLRDRLKGVGRLDVMDAVNERAMAYYGGQGRLDELPPDSLLRRARILHAKGEDDQIRGDLDTALAKFKEAYSITLAVSAKNSANTDGIFAHAQSEYWIGRTYELKAEAMRKTDQSQSRPTWEAALARYELYANQAVRLIAVAPENPTFMMEMGWGKINQARINRGLGKHLVARKFAKEALNWFKRANIAKLGDAAIQTEIADAYAWIADSHFDVREDELSLANRRIQVQILENLVKQSPKDVNRRHRLADAQYALAVNLNETSRLKESLKVVRKAANQYRYLRSIEPGNANWRRQQILVASTEMKVAVEAGAIAEAKRASKVADFLVSEAIKEGDPSAGWLASHVKIRKARSLI